MVKKRRNCNEIRTFIDCVQCVMKRGVQSGETAMKILRASICAMQTNAIISYLSLWITGSSVPNDAESSPTNGQKRDDDIHYIELFEEHETMRHQVERLKHVALRQGVKPARALTATLVAVGMMAAAA